jgi:hypothetical protein
MTIAKVLSSDLYIHYLEIIFVNFHPNSWAHANREGGGGGEKRMRLRSKVCCMYVQREQARERKETWEGRQTDRKNGRKNL